MRKSKRIEGGIFIDYECSGIVRLEEGLFLSTAWHSSESDKRFKEDLREFLRKWYPDAELPPILTGD